MERIDYLRLDRASDMIADLSESLKGLSELIETADVANAPSPYQMSCLLRTLGHSAISVSSKISEILADYAPEE